MSERPIRRTRSSEAVIHPSSSLNEIPAKKRSKTQASEAEGVVTSSSAAVADVVASSSAGTVFESGVARNCASPVAFDMSSLDGITKNVKKWTKDAYADVLARQNVCMQYQRAGSDWHVALPLPPVNPNVYITEQKFVLGRDCAHSMPSFKLTSSKALGAGTFGVVVRGEVDGKPGASSSANATETLFHDCICPSLAPCQHAHMPCVSCTFARSFHPQSPSSCCGASTTS
jgi:hypothetical protein